MKLDIYKYLLRYVRSLKLQWERRMVLWGVNGDGNRSILDEKFEFEISRKLYIEWFPFVLPCVSEI